MPKIIRPSIRRKIIRPSNRRKITRPSIHLNRGKGHPILYTLEKSERICKLLAGGWPLTQICRLPEMPTYPTIMNWLWDESDFKENFLYRYKLARDQQADYMADEIVDICDNSRNDYMERERKDGTKGQVMRPENVQRSRLRVDARKWMAAKLKPKKYGDSMSLTGKGGEELIPKATTVIIDFGGEE